MTITEKDFTMTPSSKNTDKYDLIFMKRVKKRDTGQYEIEPGDPLYGLTLSYALRLIAHHRVAKKYEDDNIALRQFLKEYSDAYNEILKLCKENVG